MLSKREKLLIHPWQLQRYKAHKNKIKNARPAIDVKTPTIYSHVTIKLKKMQAEKDRMEQIHKENVRLLQKLGDIMNTKRLKNFWVCPRPNFLNREKLIESRPITCKGRLETFNNKNKLTKSLSISGSPHRFTRCPTCNGNPPKRNQVIPEPRIPWEPPKKSWNTKIYTKEFQAHKCCGHCYI